MNRRSFFKRSSAALAAAMIANVPDAQAANSSVKKGSGFTMWQLGTQCNQIGNTYVFQTDKGRIIVMDGGFKSDEFYLRGFLDKMGGQVDTWFVSHPHPDHIGSLLNILKNPNGIKIRRIIHSRFSDPLIDGEPSCAEQCREFYSLLDNSKDMEVVDIQKPGYEGRIDGFEFKIIGVANHEILQNFYNNSSMIIRVWDKKKSLLFLGDAGIECGNKLLNGEYRNLLDCDYMQMAHHGQNGCDERFYKTVNFRACLWSTPQWVWENNAGKGINTYILKTFDTRRWMEEKGIKEHHISWMGLYQLD